MTAATSARSRLARLLVEVDSELKSLARLAEELASYRGQLDSPAPTRPVVALIAVDLHDYYTAAEALFERVARAFEEDVPSGPESHRELVDQMAADLAPIRPPVLGEDDREWLHRLRTFRHFFRHAYPVHLETSRLREHADAVLTRHSGLSSRLERFLDFVRQTMAALPTS